MRKQWLTPIRRSDHWRVSVSYFTHDRPNAHTEGTSVHLYVQCSGSMSRESCLCTDVHARTSSRVCCNMCYRQPNTAMRYPVEICVSIEEMRKNPTYNCTWNVQVRTWIRQVRRKVRYLYGNLYFYFILSVDAYLLMVIIFRWKRRISNCNFSMISADTRALRSH